MGSSIARRQQRHARAASRRTPRAPGGSADVLPGRGQHPQRRGRRRCARSARRRSPGAPASAAERGARTSPRNAPRRRPRRPGTCSRPARAPTLVAPAAAVDNRFSIDVDNRSHSIENDCHAAPLAAAALALAGVLALAAPLLAGCGTGARHRRHQVVAVVLPAAVRRPAGRRRPRRGHEPDPARPEPHDLELTVRADRRRSRDADVVVYEKGFQPAVDDAVAPERHRRRRSTPPTSASRRTATGRRRPALLAGPDPARPRSPTRSTDELAAVDPAHAADYAAQRRRPRGATWPPSTGLPHRAGGLPDAPRSWSATTPSATSATLRPRRRRPSPASPPTPSPRPPHLRRAAGPDPRATASPPSSPRRWAAPGSPTAWPATSASRTAVLDPIEGLSDADRRPGLPLADAREPRARSQKANAAAR